jgi:carboxymethylenebutenolidase
VSDQAVVSRVEVVVPASDGECPATLHVPDTGPAPAVIMYPDAAGVRETFLVMGDRLAAAGFVVLLPDVYYRHGAWPAFDAATVFGDPDERARLMGMARSVTADMMVRDAGAFLDFLAARSEVAGPLVGTTGYCMGGRESLLAAAHHPDRVGAAASFHGGRLADAEDPDSPYLLADRIRAAVYVAAAQDDASFPADQYERLEKAFAENGVRATMETYPAAHGFAVPDNATHDPSADDRHWAATTELFDRYLRG